MNSLHWTSFLVEHMQTIWYVQCFSMLSQAFMMSLQPLLQPFWIGVSWDTSWFFKYLFRNWWSALVNEFGEAEHLDCCSPFSSNLYNAMIVAIDGVQLGGRQVIFFTFRSWTVPKLVWGSHKACNLNYQGHIFKVFIFEHFRGITTIRESEKRV